MSRLALTTGTSPLWGAVPRWEVGVGDLFRDVSKRVLCSLTNLIWPDGPTSLGHSSSHPCRSGRSPWPAPGGRFVRDHRPWEQAGHTGSSWGPCDAPREGTGWGAVLWPWGSQGSPAGSLRAGDDRATQVDSDAGAESFRIPGEGGGQGMRGVCRGSLFVTNGLPSPGTWRRRGRGRAPVKVLPRSPVAAFSARRRLHTVSGHAWRLILTAAGGSNDADHRR